MKKSSLALVISICVIIAFLIAAVYFGFSSNHQPVKQADWEKHDDKMKDLDERLQALAKKIQALQGDSTCVQDDQCRVVGIGTKVCGEFKDFVVYSTITVDEPALLDAIQDFNKAHEALSNLSLQAENCGHKPAKILCTQKHCTPDIPADKTN